jgi:cysteinyl-tRNA synthetase
MSKSLGNVLTIREALDTWGRETILLFLMTGHWRKPIDLSEETLNQAKAQVETFRNAFLEAGEERGVPQRERLIFALEDDFNTPEALALFHEWRTEGELESLRFGLELFGLGLLAEQAVAPTELLGLAKRRQEARTRGAFDEADRIRREVEAAGWEIRDVNKPPGFRLVPNSP